MSENKVPVTAVVLAKNEEAAIERCVRALEFCAQVIVVDSHSDDRTEAIARAAGAEVVQFTWDGRYPKKKQWGMEHPSVRNDWVLHIDADEVVTPKLAQAIGAAVTASLEDGGPDPVVAFDVRLSYHFMGKRLRFGHQVRKRSLVDRRYTRFPEVGDLQAPGITEVEGHYQPIANGRVGALDAFLVHDDPDPLADWISRHNRYSDWEAHIANHEEIRFAVRGNRSRGGQIFDRVPFKPLVFFMYSFLLRFGFLDGRAGFDYAVSLAWYYWAIDAKTRDTPRISAPRIISRKDEDIPQ